MLESKFCLFPAISLLFRVGGRAAGWAGAGYSKNTTNSAQLSWAGAWAELGKKKRNNMQNSGHLRLCQQPRAAHPLRSDQLPKRGLPYLLCWPHANFNSVEEKQLVKKSCCWFQQGSVIAAMAGWWLNLSQPQIVNLFMKTMYHIEIIFTSEDTYTCTMSIDYYDHWSHTFIFKKIL
jgi:hypothetical protein